MISVGATVRCIGQTWIVKRAITADHWQLITRSGDGHHYMGRVAGEGEMRAVMPAPYAVGATVMHEGLSSTVAADTGDWVTLYVSESSSSLKGGGNLCIAGGNVVEVSNSDLVLSTL